MGPCDINEDLFISIGGYDLLIHTPVILFSILKTIWCMNMNIMLGILVPCGAKVDLIILGLSTLYSKNQCFFALYLEGLQGKR